VWNQVSHPHKTGEVTNKHKCIRKKAEEIKAIKSVIKTEGILTETKNLIGKWGNKSRDRWSIAATY
jgi:hypothetical protein